MLGGAPRSPSAIGVSVTRQCFGTIPGPAFALATHPHGGMPLEHHGFPWSSMPVLHAVNQGVALLSIAVVTLALVGLLGQAMLIASHCAVVSSHTVEAGGR